MTKPTINVWQHRFAVFTALATLGLVGMGGLVTSHGVGMAVPDWPTSYGYNMFALPVSTWLTGGIFHEHTHRLWAAFVGVLVVALTRWMGGSKSRVPLMMIGAAEILLGFAFLKIGPDWKGAGHFLSGIGSVVLLGGIVWVKNAPSAERLPMLGWAAFWLVQLQGLLGGLRVVLDSQVVADVRLGTVFGIVHGCLAQGFLVLLAVIALMTSRWWVECVFISSSSSSSSSKSSRKIEDEDEDEDESEDDKVLHLTRSASLRRWFLLTTLLIFVQLLIAATMRHQHAGLAISDFPLAHGELWPDMSAEAVANYNARRVDVTTSNPITAFQIGLQMTHRIVACLILVAVAVCAWKARMIQSIKPLAFAWLGLILVQVGLGAWTIWSNKAADVATAHVVVGALSLVTGALGCLIFFRRQAVSAASPEVPFSETNSTDRASA